MTADHRSSESGAVDHVAAGFEALRRCGVNVANVLTASLGHDEDGGERLFVLGGQVVLLMRTDGSDRQELHRTELRSVELVPGRGLLLRSPGKRWLHVLREEGAAYLHETLVEAPLFPPTSSRGHAVPERGWREDQLAHLVGFVIMRAAEAEHSLGLVAAHGGVAQSSNHGVFGSSGDQLIKELSKIGRSSPAVADLAERYSAWNELRNQLVHSIRPFTTDGRPGAKTHKPKQRSNFQYDVATQDLPELIDLYYAFTWLHADATKALIGLRTGMTAADLPTARSVAYAERLPTNGTGSAE